MHGSQAPVLRLALVLALLAAGCGDEDPGAPRNLVARLNGYALVLSWTPGSGADGQVLEGRVDGGAWQPLHDGLWPPDVRGASTTLNADAPELVRLDFRVVAVRGSDRAASNVAGIVTPIYPPAALVATTAPAGWTGPVAPIDVRWENRSWVAAEVQLERQLVRANGATTTWELLAVLAGARSYRDEAPVPLTVARYRVRAGTSGTWSAPVEASAPPTAPLPPEVLVAEVVPEGVAIRWTARAEPTEVHVQECPTASSCEYVTAGAATSAGVAVVPRVAGPPPWMSYRVTAVWRGAGGEVASSPAVTIPLSAFQVGDETLRADVTGIVTPPADLAVVDGQGRAHVATGDGVVHRATDAGWERHAVDGPASDLDLLVDADDHLHAVYLMADVTRGRVLRHVWHDGAGWRADAPEPLGAASSLRARMDAAGDLHAVFTEWNDGLLTTAYARWSGGTWSREVIPAPSFDAAALTVAPDGTVYVASASLYVRDRASGAWTVEAIPAAFPREILADGAGAVTLLDEEYAPGLQLRALGRGDPWTEEVIVAGGCSGILSSGASGDGTAAHAVVSCEGGPRLLDRRADGWTELPLRIGGQDWWRSGYRGGKLWILSGQRGGTAAIRFLEP